MTPDTLKRIRMLANVGGEVSGYRDPRAKDLRELLSEVTTKDEEIERLRARIAELGDALEPVAGLAGEFPEHWPDDGGKLIYIDADDVRRARSALTAGDA